MARHREDRIGVKGSRLLRFLGLSFLFHLLLLLPFLLPILFEEGEPLGPTVEDPILVRVLDQPPPETGQLPAALADASLFDSLARHPSDVEGPAQSPGSVGVPHLGQREVASGQLSVTRREANRPKAPSPRPSSGLKDLFNSAAPQKPLSPPAEHFDPGEEGEGGSVREQTVSLASRSFPSAPYLASVRRKIEGLWWYPAEAKARGVVGELLVGFTILNDGRLSRLDLLKTSGSSILDEAALGAIGRAAPYAPFPEQMDLDRLHITASFLYYHSPVPRKGGS